MERYTRVDDELEVEECEAEEDEDEDDDDEDEEDPCADYLGQIDVDKDETSVISFKQSRELGYPGSMTILEKAVDSNEHILYRYFKDEGKLAMEKMFSTSSYSDIEDMYLFDDHALAIVDDSSTLTVLYFDNFRGEELPQNYGIALISGESVVGHALAILQDGSDVELYIALKLSAAITIEKMKVIVDTKSYNSRVELDSESATVYHLFSAEFTSTRATKDLFILGCETCDSGTIWFYDRQTLELVHEITGSDEKVGVGASGSIAINDNIEKVTHLWYSTLNSDG